MKRIAVISSICIFGIYLFLSWGLYSRNRALVREMKKKTDELKLYSTDSNAMPAIDTRQILKERRLEFENAYMSYKERLESPVVQLAGIEKPALYFKEELYKARIALKAESEKEDIPVPASLGFDEIVPKDEDVPALMAKLEIAKALIESAIANEVNQVISLEFLPPEQKKVKDEPEPLFKEVPVKLKLNAGTKELLSFLDNILEYGHFFCIKEVRIESNLEGMLTTELLVSGFIFAGGKEDG